MPYMIFRKSKHEFRESLVNLKLCMVIEAGAFGFLICEQPSHGGTLVTYFIKALHSSTQHSKGRGGRLCGER